MFTNSDYPWDGSHIGSFVLSATWVVDGSKYYALSSAEKEGTLVCKGRSRVDNFSCIVSEIADIFAVPRQGVHRASVYSEASEREWILYYVPLLRDKLVWEVPLSYLPSSHYLRSNALFSHYMRVLVVFADCLALSGTSENTICIRNIEGRHIPLLTSDTCTKITRGSGYDYSTLQAPMINKWFAGQLPSSAFVRERFTPGPGTLVENTTELRGKIEHIIRKYDANYLWYSTFVIDRLSRYLL